MLHFLIGTKRTEIAGPDITINCLWCGKQLTRAHTRKRVEWLTLFHLLPLLRFRTIFVQCDSCKKDMIARCSLEDLAGSNPLTLKHLLVKDISPVGKVCIALGYLLSWAFYLGLIPAIIGYVYGRKYGGTMRKVAFWGLILNLFSPVLFILLFSLIDLLAK